LAPDELCDRERFPSAASVRAHLLDTFIPHQVSRYALWAESNDLRPPVRPPDQTRRNLARLARHLELERHTKQLRWWELTGMAPAASVPSVVGIICALTCGYVAATGRHIGIGIGIGLGVGIYTGLGIGLPMRWASRRFDDWQPGMGMRVALFAAADEHRAGRCGRQAGFWGCRIAVWINPRGLWGGRSSCNGGGLGVLAALSDGPVSVVSW
jgi:hypothetical protein